MSLLKQMENVNPSERIILTYDAWRKLMNDVDALERVARAADAFADDRWEFDMVSDSATPATWIAVIDALKEVEHLLGVDK